VPKSERKRACLCAHECAKERAKEHTREKVRESERKPEKEKERERERERERGCVDQVCVTERETACVKSTGISHVT